MFAQMEAFAAEGVWPASIRNRTSISLRLKIAFLVAGMLVGIAVAAVYFWQTPVRYLSVATFVIAPNSLASTTQASPISGSALSSLLGAGGGFSEIDVYDSRIHSRDFMTQFLADNPDVVKKYRPYLGDLADADPRHLPLVVVDAFSNDFIRMTPTTSPRILQLEVEASTPGFAANVGGRLLAAMNAMIRNSAIREHGGRLNYLRQQLSQSSTANVDVRASLISLLTEEWRKMTLIEGSPDYGVQVIDSPTINPRPNWPRRSIVFGLGLLNGALFGILVYWLVYSRRWF